MSRLHKFQSAPPVKGATFVQGDGRIDHLFQSAPPVKGATPFTCKQANKFYVSIRAPREGGDPSFRRKQRNPSGFNPRPP